MRRRLHHWWVDDPRKTRWIPTSPDKSGREGTPKYLSQDLPRAGYELTVLIPGHSWLATYKDKTALLFVLLEV